MTSQHGHHIVPKKILYKVFSALVVLTVLTALTAQIDLGAGNVPLALLIAGTKATLVVMFFMALKYDKKVNTLVFALGIVFVVVFLVFTLFDTAFRGDIGNVGTETISDIERREEVMRARESALQPAPDTPQAAGADTTAAAVGADATSDTTDESSGASADTTDD